MSYFDESRAEARRLVGRDIPEDELNEAFVAALNKLSLIIFREGDAEGERRKPYYLAMLIREHIAAAALSSQLAAPAA